MKYSHFLLFFCVIFTFPTNTLKAAAVLTENERTIDSLCNIVANPRLSLQKKITAVKNTSYYLNAGLSEKLKNSLFGPLLSECKRKKDTESLAFCYNALIMPSLYDGKMDEATLYLDSATMYIDGITNIRILAAYWYTKALYTSFAHPRETFETYRYFYKALGFYEQLEGTETQQQSIMYYCVFDAQNRNDTAQLQILAKKVNTLKKKQKNPLMDYLYYCTTQTLYQQYFNKRERASDLDSSIFYGWKCLDALKYLPSSPDIKQSEILTLASMAEMLAIEDSLFNKNSKEKKTMDGIVQNQINNEKTIKRLFTTADSIVSVCPEAYLPFLTHAKAHVLFMQRNYSQAKKLALEAEEQLSNPKYDLFYLVTNCENLSLLREISDIEKDYKNNAIYTEKYYSIREKLNDLRTKEMELQYETDSRDAKIRQLNTEEKNQRYTKYFFASLASLLIITLIITLFAFFSYRKNKRQTIKLLQNEKFEIEMKEKLYKEEARIERLKASLQEEEAANSEMEKYEILAELNLQKSKINEKDKKLERLQDQKQLLDSQIDTFKKRVNEYEQNKLQNNEEKNEAPLENNSASTFQTVQRDIQSLIDNKLHDSKNISIYLSRLNAIKENCIANLYNKHHGTLSIQYLKYCICFAIGLNNNEISKIFFVELLSVHSLRHRLKKRFELKPEDDLDFFLKTNLMI